MASTPNGDPNQDALKLIKAGLSAGQEFTSGSARIRVVGANKALQSLTTGRFVPSAVLDAEARAALSERDRILKNLATKAAVLLALNLHDLTAHQYATLRELARMGHPYAKRKFKDARGRYNPAKSKSFAFTNTLRAGGVAAPVGAINEQSGALMGAFDFSEVRKPGGVYAVLCKNPLLYSGYLADGTGSMIARAYDQKAADATRRQMAADVAEAGRALSALGVGAPGDLMPEMDFTLGMHERSFK